MTRTSLEAFARYSKRSARPQAAFPPPSELQLTKEELTKLRQDCQSLPHTSRDFQRRVVA